MAWANDRQEWIGSAAGRLAHDRPRLAALAVLAVGAMVSLAADLPGHMSYDSVLQLAQGRSGVFNAWHPPIMAWMLGVLDAAAPGTGLFVVFDTLLIYGSLALLVLAARRSSWLAAPLVLIWAAIPDGLIYPGTVWKDVLFAGAASGGFAVLAMLPRVWRHRRWRFATISAAFLFLTLGTLARQNGIVILPAAAIACGWIAARHGDRPPKQTALAYALAPLAAAILLMTAANAALAAHGDGEPSQAYQLEDLQAYDLAAALRAEPDLALERLKTVNPSLESLLRTKAAAAYSPERLDAISAMPDLSRAYLDTPASAMSDQWRELVLRHPWLYLKIRARDFAWVFFTPKVDACLPFFVGVHGPQPWVSRLGLVNGERPQDVALNDWAEPWAHSPLASHALYAAVAAALLVLLLRRRREADIAVAGLLASALAFTATFFLISVACDYRYLYFLDMAAAAGAIYAACDAGGLGIRRPPPAAP